MLMLNRISTNHGLNWGKGLLFTICIALVFYSLYIVILPSRPFKLGWTSWNSFLIATDATFEYFLRFFNITHELDFMSKYSPNSISYLIDFLGKIFIGYGIYQTIQAFRKYGKAS